MKRFLHGYRPHFVAAAPANASTAMSSRPPYRGGRNHPRRNFFDRPYTGGISHNVSGLGDPHFRPVREANLGFHHGDSGSVEENSGFPAQERPPHSQNQSFRPPPPQQRHFHQNPQFRQRPQYHRPPPFEQNQPQRPPQQFRPRPPDYRIWEYAKSAPPSTSERFTILSYNLLADYVALGYRHRMELFSHIPRRILDWGWRKGNIIFELGLWSTDIMCFQEVDRFQDLEEELKLRGYNGIWKRRTGKPLDGCAIFWRASRFKLLHEESIEFKNFGLRDNVAQICVLELISQNCEGNAAALETSSTGSNKVVVCNIHVLYNPSRGDIKLGQVRTLLFRAHAVSKLWNDAPIVLCGDFNCVPKSPIYNYISEQKLDISGLHRDKLSGQASAVIGAQRTYNPNPGLRSGDNLNPAPSVLLHREDGIKQNESSFDTQKLYNADSNPENVPSVENFSQPQSSNALDACDTSNTGVERRKDGDEVKEESEQISANYLSDGSRSTCCMQSAELLQDVSMPEGECGSSTGHSRNSDPKIYLDEESMGRQSEQIYSDEQAGFSGPSQAHGSSASISIEVQEKFDNLFFNDIDKAITEDGNVVEDSSTFLSALHNTEDASPRKLGQLLRSGPAETDPSKDLDPEPLVVDKSYYDPSSWTPGDIETATGNADCTSLEHPLKLRSTYTEVEDTLGIRDSNGEPLVTSYNKCFMGTVDYIWRSERLQTVKVLAPIPKQVMQTIEGFPTKKWASDHIALASELAFVKDETNHNAIH
ncbi:carbon catabolite repressor protein 4 homolog 6 isoform X2 [Morus notabilis]|uniref:carbon catabolite repressor protein 4 homolog 6 isoform X2 n=1 Tax=Morus notabilis TaxID=981085 RepID=UPI000CED526F|nr:carbon catabolite repressor protein 4 homolog 6 isoform X2 [Morus notabilis]